MTNFSPTQLLTVKDVAELLQISKNQAYTLVHSKDFPMCKINGSIRVSVQRLINGSRLIRKDLTPDM